MDSLDLLAREDEFKKLNKQLEKKTESLMKEIEYVMQKQDIFSEFSHKLSFTPTHASKKHICKPPEDDETLATPPKNYEKHRRKSIKSPKNKTENDNNENLIQTAKYSTTKTVICDCCVNNRNIKLNDNLEFLQAFISVNVQEKVLPSSFLKEVISVESLCKFLSSKIKLLQEQIDTLQTSLDKKANQCKVHLTHQAELEGERLGLLNKINTLQASTADARAKASTLEAKLSEKDRVYKEQRSECDRLNVELKRMRADYTGVCSRHAAQSEAIATLTQQLKAAKAEHLEFRDSTRALSASNEAAIAALDARNKTLQATVNKQTALIDNLRKQNAVLRTEGALRVLEQDYSDFLNQDL